MLNATVHAPAQWELTCPCFFLVLNLMFIIIHLLEAVLFYCVTSDDHKATGKLPTAWVVLRTHGARVDAWACERSVNEGEILGGGPYCQGRVPLYAHAQ